MFGLEKKINTLWQSYPFQLTITATKEDYEKDKSSAITKGLLTTVASWVTIYQLAKRGTVLPFLRQYGGYFKSHRIFRQYLYTLVLPVPALLMLNTYQYSNHVEYLWSVHINRNNAGIR